MPDANTLYYTLSTIPQVLAGAIGLLGVFVLYKLDRFSTEVVELSKNLKADMAHQRRLLVDRHFEETGVNTEHLSARIETNAAAPQTTEFVDLVGLCLAPEANSRGRFARKYDRWRDKDPRAEFLRRVRSSIILTSVTIAASLIALPLTESLKNIWGVKVLIVAVLMSVASILWTGVVVWQSVQDD